MSNEDGQKALSYALLVILVYFFEKHQTKWKIRCFSGGIRISICNFALRWISQKLCPYNGV